MMALAVGIVGRRKQKPMSLEVGSSLGGGQFCGVTQLPRLPAPKIREADGLVCPKGE